MQDRSANYGSVGGGRTGGTREENLEGCAKGAYCEANHREKIGRREASKGSRTPTPLPSQISPCGGKEKLLLLAAQREPEMG